MPTFDEQFQQNLAALARRPGSEEMVTSLAQYPLTNMQLFPNAQGQLIGQVWDVTQQRWIPLCSSDDPIAEAERDVEALYTPQCKVFTLIGLGLGYFATAFLKRLKPYQRLVIWDLDACMYKAMLYAVDATPFLNNMHRVDIFVGDQIMSQIDRWWMALDAMEKLYLAGPMRAGYTAGYQCAGYDALLEKTVDMLRYHGVGMSTWRAFGRCIGDNDLENAPEYFLHPGYEHLAGLWEGKPAVCIAAGPSLHKNLAQLYPDAIRQRIAVMCAGTVYALAHGMGLHPEIVTTIDFQRLNWTDQFLHVPLDPHSALVYLHSTYPQTPRRWPGPRFVAENASDTTSWLRQYSEGKKSAAQVQTVAHLNLLVALELGANPIILVGQDLAMPRAHHHAAGARAQDLAPQDAPPEAFVEVPGWDGQPVLSRHSFLSMKTVFERLIAEHPETRFLNCSEAGLALAGADHLPLAEALAPLREAPVPAPLSPAIRERFHKYVPHVKPTLRADFARLQEDVATFDRLTRRLLAFHREMGDETAALRQAILQHEHILQERQAAFSLFAIRHFGLIELLSAIPPEEAILSDTAQRERFNCARLVRVAQMLQDTLPEVQRLLRRTATRLRDVLDVVERRDEGFHIPASFPEQLQARQHYHLLLQEWPLMRDPHGWQLYAKHLTQTQQYPAAISVLRDQVAASGSLPRLTARMRQYEADVRAALPAYFPSGQEPGEPPVVLKPSGDADIA